MLLSWDAHTSSLNGPVADYKVSKGITLGCVEDAGIVLDESGVVCGVCVGVKASNMRMCWQWWLHKVRRARAVGVSKEWCGWLGACSIYRYVCRYTSLSDICRGLQWIGVKSVDRVGRKLSWVERRQGIPVYFNGGADRIGSDVPPLRKNSGTDTSAAGHTSTILADASPAAPSSVGCTHLTQ